MEMTNRRWIALVLSICVIIAAFRLPPRANRAQWGAMPVVRTSDSARRLRMRITALHETAIIIARRDSLAAALSANTRSGPMVVRLAQPSASENEMVRRAVEVQARGLGTATQSLVLAIVKDTASAFPLRANYRSDRQFILPSGTDGKTCITLLRLGRGKPGLERDAQNGIFGPCAFHASFGAPGPAADHWLRKRGYDVAVDAVWPADSRPDPSRFGSRRLTVEEDIARWFGSNRGWIPPDVAACSSGAVDTCARAMRAADPRNAPPGELPVVREGAPSWFESSLGPDKHSFLSDLLTAHGRTKFEKFWKSSGDLETAFKAAFGESTGEWTMRWMQYRYGKDTRGPAVAPRSALLAIAFSLAFVGLCAIAFERQQAL